MKPICEYLDYSGRDDVLAGGVRMVPIDTPAGAFKVWTKRIGNNPALRVLGLLQFAVVGEQMMMDIVFEASIAEVLDEYLTDACAAPDCCAILAARLRR